MFRNSPSRGAYSVTSHPTFFIYQHFEQKMHAVSVSMTNYASMKPNCIMPAYSTSKPNHLFSAVFFSHLCQIEPSFVIAFINLEWPIIHKKGSLVKISELFQFLNTAFMKAKHAVN